jgi:NADH:ubiquinone oxidoreductase subunit 6 (subunit J)
LLFEQILFFLAAAGAIGGALGVVVLRNPFFSVLALVGHLVALAVLFLLLHAEFAAAIQIVLYAGAVMVMYIFVVAYIGGADEPLGRRGVPGFFGPLVAAALVLEVTIAIVGSSLKAIDSRGPDVESGFGSTEYIGELFLTKFLIAYEVAGVLLTITAVGAIVLARRRRGLDEPSDIDSVLAVGSDLDQPRGPRSVFDREQEARIPAGTAEGRDDPTAERGG